jgi:hypothetical protein
MEEWTIQIEPNGFGAMYQSIMLGLGFCRKNGYTYTHTPFRSIHHGVNANEGNVFIGFFNKDNYKLPSRNAKKIVYDEKLWGANPDEYLTENVINELRYNYQSTPKPAIEPHNNFILIHIRRGDVCKELHPNRYDSSWKYINYISWLKAENKDLPIIICSQGKPEDFKDITDNHDVILRLNHKPLEDFNFMVQAKVLVIARSSYSYTAGVLNENVVYCDTIKNNRWFHKPLSKWKTIEEIEF